jgi:hypothetical protein
MLDGDAPRGLSQAFTPCFRDEKKHDKYHHPYFLKLELFNPECSKEALRNMLQDAVAFYETHLPVRVVKADNGLDIVTHNGLELGSYGMRELNYQGETYRWTYGTGCAEPRLSQALGEFRN